MRSLALEALSIRSFRNLACVDIALGRGVNVIAGDNGQGKTSLLEAAYMAATSRSFRTSRLADVVTAGARVASVRALIAEDSEKREQTVGFGAGQRHVRVDGKRPAGLAEFAVRTPVVIFHPGAVALSAGPGRERRRLLDRIALYTSAASWGESAALARAMQARQRLLEMGGEAARGIDAWEQLVVRHGGAVMRARRAAVQCLASAVSETFGRLGPSGLTLALCYEPSAPDDEEAFARALAGSRRRDRARRSASVGPHRDELGLVLGGKAMRATASQGQHRAVVLALQLAEMAVIGEVRGVRPVLLLDDVSSELDRARTAALIETLRAQEGQVLLTTTRPEVVQPGGHFGVEERRDFVVVQGEIRASGP